MSDGASHHLRATTRALAVALSLTASTAVAAPPAHLARSAEELEVEAWLNALPPEEAEAALRELVAEQGGATVAHAISPGALFVRNPAGGERFLFDRAGGYAFSGVVADAPCFYAGVRLPDGATVTGLVVWYRELEGGTVYAALHRKGLASLGNADVMAAAASSSGSPSLRALLDVSIAFPAVDNRSFYYYAELCLPTTDSELHGAYVTFAP